MGNRWMKMKRNTAIWPFIIGLAIGLILSIGLRILSSKSGFCRTKYQETIDPVAQNQEPILQDFDGNIGVEDDKLKSPDQIVNLDDSNGIPKIQGNLLHEVEENLPNQIENEQNSILGFLEDSPENTGKSKRLDTEKSVDVKENLLMVGVMTAQKYLSSRALGVYETWAKEIPGRVIFFTGANISSFNSADQGADSKIGDGSGKYNSKREIDSIPLVALPGVDDSYPPQKKSFMMLKYMYDHYGDKYEWFMRADDDVYVRAEKLSEFLRSINSRHLYFIGQAGRGNRAEKGTLNLAHNENFCMGGPGIILSRPTLAKVASQVHHCLQDMYSTHEDVEVGRCVQRFAGISCTWAYEMQAVFYHNSSGDRAFTGNLKRREIHRAITLHPIKNYRHLYRLHAYFQGLKIQDQLYESLLLQRDLLSFQSKTKGQRKWKGSEAAYSWHSQSPLDIHSPDFHKDGLLDEIDSQLNITGLLPSLNKYLPHQESQIIGWDFIGKGIFSDGSVNPKHKIDAASKEALEDVVREMMDIINGYSRVRGRVIDFKEILYGYHRVNPLYGDDYVLDLLMTYKKYRGRKMTVPVRRHVYIQRPFTQLNLRLVNNINNNLVEKSSQNVFPSASPVNPLETTKDPVLTMIVPLSGRFATFQRFLESFRSSCSGIGYSSSIFTNLYSSVLKDFDMRTSEFSMKGQNNTEGKESTKDSHYSHPFPTSSLPLCSLNLIVVYFGSDTEKEKFLELVNTFRENTLKTSSLSSSCCKIKVVQVDGEFSRSIALETGISQCNEDDLLFLIDVDIVFTPESLQRVRLNTIKGKRVYFPIVFSQYNPRLFPTSATESKYSNSTSKLSSDIGYWREYGFGTAAFYKSDFRTAGGFDISIKGWGKEDVALFDRFLRTELIIFRAPDPGLIHVYHDIHCDDKLSHSQHEMCLGTQSNTLGSVGSLMKFIYKHRRENPRFQKAIYHLNPDERI